MQPSKVMSIGGLFACAIVFSIALISPAWSQDAVLEEIVVTAERREGTLQDTPISIVAFSGDDLQELGVTNIEELGAFLPNVSIGGLIITGNQPNFVIRGIGQNRTNLGNDRGVGLYVDDIYYSPATNSLLSVMDVERVEVLRGPQGTLFGRNTTGGAIRYITKKPTNEFEGTVRGTVGNFARTDVRGILNVPFSDNFYGRFTAASLSRDGYVTQALDNRDLGNQDERIFRAQFRWVPSDSLTIDLTTDHINFQNNGDPQYINGAVNTGGWYVAYANAFPGTPLYTDVVNAPECETNLECTIPGSNWGEISKGETTISTFTVQWDINDSLSFKALTGYTNTDNTHRNDFDLSVLDVWHSGPIVIDWESLSQEFQLSGSAVDDRLRWTAGLYFADEEGTQTGGGATSAPFGPTPGIPRPNTTFSESTVENQGAYFDFTYDFSEQFSLTAGIRYSADDKWLNTSRSDRQGGQAFSNSADWNDTFGRIVFEYRPADSVMLYASYAEGYKAGAIADQISPSPAIPNGNIFPFDEETAETVELGLRSEWIDNRLRLNLTLYDTDYTDLQITAFRQVPVGGGLTEPVLGVANAGDVAMDGWEFEFLAAATDRLTFDFSFAKLNHEIVSVGSGGQGTITVDSILPRSPEDTWKAGMRYELPLSSGASLRFAVDHAFTDEQKSFLSDGNSTVMPDFGLTNARVTFTDPDERWTAALFCTNCTDEYFITAQHFNRAQWGGSNTILGRPRMYGVEANVSF